MAANLNDAADRRPDGILGWRWVDHDTAADLAAQGTPITETLRQAHGLLSRVTFEHALRCGQVEILLLPGNFAALVTWGETEAGLCMNVLTVTGSYDNARLAFLALEAAARYSEARQIISIGAPGWQRLVESIGYTTETRLCMHKRLT